MMRLFLTLVLVMQSSTVLAEQMQQLGQWDVHYILLPTTLLKPDVAASYGITRGRDRALLNVSVLNREQLPTAVAIDGHMRLVHPPEEVVIVPKHVLVSAE